MIAPTILDIFYITLPGLSSTAIICVSLLLSVELRYVKESVLLFLRAAVIIFIGRRQKL